MLLESFVIYKTLVDKVILRTKKFDYIFCYSNVHQMFSILLWALIYFFIFLNAHVLNPLNEFS
jgi:hypothetical protein